MKMENEMLELLLNLVDNKIVQVIENDKMLDWAKNHYLKQLANTRKELIKQLKK